MDGVESNTVQSLLNSINCIMCFRGWGNHTPHTGPGNTSLKILLSTLRIKYQFATKKFGAKVMPYNKENQM
jgi:hypothetical protein